MYRQMSRGILLLLGGGGGGKFRDGEVYVLGMIILL